MRLDEKQFKKILRSLRSEHQFKILNTLNKDNGFRFVELKKKVNGDKSFAFHLMRLVEAKVVKKEQDVYCLTRIGIASMELMDDFKELCMSFDLTDCDADGKIRIMVER